MAINEYMNTKGSSAKVAELIAKLLYGSASIHMLHLSTKSYAHHMALGSLYESLPGLVDGVIEQYQGCFGVIPSYPTTVKTKNNPVALVQDLYDYLSENRMVLSEESHIQNDVDTILAAFASCLYKLKNLS